MASVCGINLQDRFCFPFLALTPCPFLVLFIANPLARCVPLRFLVFFTLLPLDLVLQKQQSASKSPYEKIRIPKSARQRADAGWVWPCGSHNQPAKTLTKKSGFRKARQRAARRCSWANSHASTAHPQASLPHSHVRTGFAKSLRNIDSLLANTVVLTFH